MKNNTDRHSKTAQYWKEAKAFVKARSDDPLEPAWIAFAYASEAREIWSRYFHWRLGFLPAGMVYLAQRQISEFLVPCELPEDFDRTYAPNAKRYHP